MFPSIFRATVAVLCAAFLCALAGADDKKPAEKALRKPTVIRLTTLDAEEVAPLVKKLMPPKTVIVPIADENALLLYVTDQELKEIHAILKVCAEKAPAKVEPKTFEFRLTDAKWDDVLVWYAKTSGLTLITTAQPKGEFSFTPTKPDQRFTLAEITDILNDALAAQKLVLVRRHMTFFILDLNEKREPRDWGTLFKRISLEELPECGRTELVRVIIPVEGPILADEPIHSDLKRMLSPLGSLLVHKNWLLLQDTAGNVAKIKKKLDELSAPKPMPAPKPPESLQPAARPAPEKGHAVHFKDAEWGFVLDWYAKLGGLKADVRVKPKGMFNCTPGKERQFTFDEITDLINQGLAEQKLILIPHRKTFAVVSTEGKIDPKLIPVVTVDELSRLPRTAIVEVELSLARHLTAEDVVDERKKLVTPLGEIVSAKGKRFVVRDAVGNINRIRETIEL